VRRIPSLDGLRGISIIFVVVGHLVLQHVTGTPARYAELYATLGVRIFFVISGFLITGLLLQEHDRSQRIDLPRFYLRRTLRIFPPYYVLIAIALVLQAAGAFTLAPHDGLHALTYTANYYPKRSWFFGHLWSLSVEEQFYLLWPATLLLLRPRRALRACAVLLVVCPAIRLLMRTHAPIAGYEIGKTFETVADSLAAGCLLSGIQPWLRRNETYRRFLASPWFALVPAAVLAVCALETGRPLLKYAVTFPAMNVGIALSIDWAVTHHDRAVGRLLNTRVLSAIGLVSYSIYLWQQLFLHPGQPYLLSRFPLNIVAIAVCAAGSYFLIERPALSLRRRFEAPR
jgi:peptidoglycan/LPS O-acetylase OafA/YrhL